MAKSARPKPTDTADDAPADTAALDVLADEIDDRRPEVSEHVIETTDAAESQQDIPGNMRPAEPGPRDRDGRAFDPAIHMQRDGQPVTNKDGSLRVKPGTGSPRAKSRLAEPAQQPTALPTMQSPTETGAQIAEAIFTLGRLIGGEDWAPLRDERYGIDERAQMRDAWGKYAAEKQWPEPPAIIVVAMVTGSYVAIRMNKPATKARLTKAKEWLQLQYIKWRNRGRTPDEAGNG